LGNLLPSDAVLPAPESYALVTLIRPTISGFFMAPEPIKTKLAMSALKNVQYITSAHQQRLAQLSQCETQIQQRLSAKQPLPLRSILLLPQLGLNDIKRKHWPPKQGLLQGLVILHPEVSLEPDKLERHCSQPPKSSKVEPNH
jgi:hypothetical protein